MSDEPQTCSGCRHWRKLPPSPQDLRRVLGLCVEGPPAPVAVAVGPGQVQISAHHPPVGPDWPACARFAPILLEVPANGCRGHD